MYRLAKKLLATMIPRLYMADPAPGAAVVGGDPPLSGAAQLVTPPPAPPAPAPAPPGGGTWYDGFKDAATKEWLKNYNNAYPDAESVALKALNLEKFIGADKAGRGVVVPKADAKPEEWKAFWSKVGGVPEKADGYKLPETLAKDALAGKFREYAHSIGMPPQFFEGALGFLSKELEAFKVGDAQDFSKASEADLLTLKDEWKGIEYDKNVELARRAAKQFVPHKTGEELTATLSKIEGALGTAQFMRLWASIGGAMSEHGFVVGEGGGGGGGMTLESAKIRVKELQADKAWGAKFSAGDADAKAEWDKLHKIIASYADKKGT